MYGKIDWKNMRKKLDSKTENNHTFVRVVFPQGRRNRTREKRANAVKSVASNDKKLLCNTMQLLQI